MDWLNKKVVIERNPCMNMKSGPFCISNKQFGQSIKVCKTHI